MRVRVREHAEKNEDGAVLILALIFLVAVSLIVTALLSWVGTSLSASTVFSSERTLENAASNAVNTAIGYTRTNFVPQSVNISPPVACLWSGINGTGTAQQPPPDSNPNDVMSVWCSMVWQPSSPETRIVTYSACLSTESNAACAAAPFLQVVVTFDDYAVGLIVPEPTPYPCSDTGLCGQSLTQNSWQWRPTVPTVSTITPTTSSISGGTQLTVTGTGFVLGSTVNFVQESSDTPTSANVVITIPVAQVQVSGCTGPNSTCTTLTVNTPAVTSGSQYFVTVTTPGGTSAYVPTGDGQDVDVVQYSVTQPAVYCVTGAGGTSGAQQGTCPAIGTTPGGTITGGDGVTINGTGFYNVANFAAQVWFCTSTSCTSKYQAQNVQVVSNTEITAVTPAVGSTGTFYIEVLTVGGTSPMGSPPGTFSYSALPPLIISLSPSSGGPSTQVTSITITGENYLTTAGATTVAFYPTANWSGTQFSPATNVPASVSVTSPTAMTVTIPSGLTKGTTYYPYITISPPGGSTLNSQPYNEPADQFTYTG